MVVIQDISIGNFFDQLVILLILMGDELNFLNVFSLHYFNFDLTLVVLVPLHHQSLEQDIYLVHVVKLLEIWLQLLLLVWVLILDRLALLRVLSKNDEFTVLIDQFLLIYYLIFFLLLLRRYHYLFRGTVGWHDHGSCSDIFEQARL